MHLLTKQEQNKTRGCSQLVPRCFCLLQIPVSTIYKKEWPWKKPKAQTRSAIASTGRRRESTASSLGAASVRRLLSRQPPKLPRHLVRKFTLLCISTGLCASALVPFTAYAGAEAGALPLAVMHTVAAIVAPFSPLILQKTGARTVIAVAHGLVCVLLIAHTFPTPLSILLALYGLCGVTLSPMTVALAAAATSLAQSAGDEGRRKIALRRALRALRAAQDAGMVFGTMLLGAALLIWPEDRTPPQFTVTPTNATVAKWPPSQEFFTDDDDYEVSINSLNHILISYAQC